MSEHHFEIVCRYDEAIDAEAMTSEERTSYRDSFDTSLLKFIPGERPAVFFARRLRNSEMEECASQATVAATNRVAFAMGIMRVSDLRVGDERRAWVRSTPKPLNEKALDDFDFADIQEIGSAIYGRCHLGKGRPAAWPLPATSQRALEALVRRRVAQTTKRAEGQSSEPAAAPAGETTVSSSDGGTPGAATATG